LRLCYIADVTSIHAQRWANYFAERGHEVHFVSRRYTQGYEGLSAGVQIHSLARLVPLPQASRVAAHISALPWVMQVRSLVKKTKADIVHADFIGVPGYLGAASGFHPLVLTARGSDIMIVPRQNPVYRWLAKRALKLADRIICVSPALREEILKLGTSPNKIEMTPVGVDTREFSAAQRNDSLLRMLGIGDSPVVMSTRGLKPIYDVQTLVRAIPLVLREKPGVKFVIAGAGEQEDHLKELARDLRVASNTKFVGWVPRTEMPKYLSSADIYVSASLSDGTSASLLEAMACELAPVVTDIRANRPWVKEGENGFLFPVRDHAALASKVIYLLKNRETRDDFGRRSRDVVQKNAEEGTEMRKLERVYHELVEARTGFRKT
jgi:glycosyltransferase involved in cell wall biosynthesis